MFKLGSTGKNTFSRFGQNKHYVERKKGVTKIDLCFHCKRTVTGLGWPSSFPCAEITVV